MDSVDDKNEIRKGKYEVFEVGEELVLSASRDKIKKYAKQKDIKHINYRFSVDDKSGLEYDLELT